MLQALQRTQIVDRFNSLPEKLQDAILSPSINEEIWRICQLNHLNDDKIVKTAKIVGRVFLGFIDIDDMANILRDYAELPPELAGSIARELTRKIFTFYAADIAKIYSPAGEGAPLREGVPEILPKEEVLRPQKIAVSEEIKKEAPQIRTKIEAPASKPASLPTPAPFPAQTIKITPKETPLDAALSSAPGIKPPSAVPFILHKEEKIQSVSESKPLEIRQVEVNIEAPRRTEMPAPIAARLELGEEGLPFGGKKKEPVIAKTEAPAQRIVHYSDFRTPVNPFEKKGDQPSAQPAPAPARQPEPPKPLATPSNQEIASPAAPVAQIPSYLPSSPDLWPRAQEPEITRPTAPPAAAKPENKPAPMPSIKPSPSVKVEGNIVDLRQK